MPAAMEELLPVLVMPENYRTRERVDEQLLRCRECVKCYHTRLELWRAKGAVYESEADQLVSMWRLLDANRLVSLLASAVRKYRSLREDLRGSSTSPNGTSPNGLEHLRQTCENVLFELLLDARLTMRKDVAASIGAMFAVLNPVAQDETEAEFVLDELGMCLPGIYVLCFHESGAVRGWAHRCLKKYTVGDDEIHVSAEDGSLVLPLGANALLEHCTWHIENGLGSSVIDLTLDDTDARDTCRMEIFTCCRSVFWEGFPVLMEHFASVESLSYILERHASLVATLVYSMGDSHSFVVRGASRVYVHLLRVLSYRLWLQDDNLSPIVVVETVIQAYQFETAKDDVKEGLLDVFPALVRSLTHASSSVSIEALKATTSFLFDMCAAPKSYNTMPLFRPGVSVAGSSSRYPPKSVAFKAARIATAEVILACFSVFPMCISFLDENRVGELLEQMLVQCSNPHPFASRLLRTILVADAMSIVRAFTSPEVETLATSARPRHLKGLKFSKQTDPKDLSEPVVNENSPSSRVDQDGSKPGEVVLGGEEDMIDPSQREDLGAGDGLFEWCQNIWKRLLKGRFRVLSLGAVDSKKGWPECVALLEVHALIGMLEVPGGELSLERAEERVAVFTSEVQCESEFDEDLQRSKLSLAYVTAMTAVHSQLKRGLQSFSDKRNVEAWVQVVPQAAGHLMASTHKGIRQLTFQLLTQLSGIPATRTGSEAGVNLGGNKLVIRLVLGNARYGPVVVRGTGHAARLLSVYGPSFSFQCYLHMARWVHQLFSSQEETVIKFLGDNGQEQIACMVEQFILNWESNSCNPLFSEAMSRFLKELQGMWKWLIADVNKEAMQKKHYDLLDVVFCLKSCGDESVRANWVDLLYKAVRDNGRTGLQLEIVANLLSCSEKEPCNFRAAECAKLVDAFGLPPVAYPQSMHLSGSDANIHRDRKNINANGGYARHQKIPVPSTEMHIPSMSGNNGQPARNFVQRSKRSEHHRPPLNSRFSSSEDARLRAVSAKLNLKPKRPSDVYFSDEMVSVHRPNRLRQALGSRPVKSAPSGRKIRPNVKKGPSKMERMVAGMLCTSL